VVVGGMDMEVGVGIVRRMRGMSLVGRKMGKE
jgi:hypothetical protein